MKTCDPRPQADREGRQRSEWRLDRLDGPTSIGSRFACPVCGEGLTRPVGTGEIFVECTGCGSGVVAPQPEFGCRSMPYRDWLRLQEIDWELAKPVSLPRVAAENPRVPRLALPSGQATSAIIKPHRRHRMLWALALSIVAAVAWMAWANLNRPMPQAQALVDSLFRSWPSVPPSPSSPPARSGTPEADTYPLKSEPAPQGMAHELDRPSEAHRPHAPPLALADLPQSPGTEHGPMIVRASRTHDFARSAPPEETHVCLKLTDPDQTAAGVRAYVLRSSDSGSMADSLLPWGRERRVHVRIRWEAPNPAQGRAGHWLVVELANAEPALTATP